MQGPKVAVNHDGDLYVAYGGCRPHTGTGRGCDPLFSAIYVAKSSDGGASFEWINASQRTQLNDPYTPWPPERGNDFLTDLLPANPGVYLFWEGAGRFVRYIY